MAFLVGHLFRAEWQHLQFESMRNSAPFPHSTVGMGLHFAQNFTCVSQDEVQAAHWHHTQVTVHPIVTYYKCEPEHQHSGTATEQPLLYNSFLVHMVNVQVEVLNIDTIRPFFEDQSIKIQTRVDRVDAHLCGAGKDKFLDSSTISGLHI